jgi:hypothetical protein
MKKTILIIFLAIGITAQAQIFDKDYNDKSYAYFSVGSSYATTPHTNNFTPNGIFSAGVFWNVFDISLNYEYVKLTPDYHSYYTQALVRPFTIRQFEFLIGAKYGRIIRVDEGTYNYFGGTGEIRYNIHHCKLFISLQGNYDRRGDILYKWGNDSDYWKYTTHLKIGIKL